MKAIKKLLIFFFMLIAHVSFTQENSETYFLKINNKDYVPNVINPDSSIVQLTVNRALGNSRAINQIFASYTIYSFRDLFKGTNDPLFHDVYVIRLDASDNLNLLTNAFPTIYPSYTIEEKYPPLYTPNDFENSSLLNNIRINTTADYEQNDLKMIRAEEAWNISKGDTLVRIGIVDTGFYVDHEEFYGEFVGGLPGYINQISDYTNNYIKHGNYVASYASAKTDNNLGFSSIGFNTKLVGAKGGSNISTSLALAQSALKPKVINVSFGSDYSSFNQSTQNMLNQIRDLGVVMVIAGGNGEASGSGNTDTYYYPASYKNVIAVSTVGNKNDIGSTSQLFDNWKDVHKVYNVSNGQIVSHQHNDSIDIVVPAYYPSPTAFVDPNPNDPWVDNYINHQEAPGGTSFSAPIVAGVIGLMFSENFCLKPNEIETILKLTAVKVDSIAENLEFYGRLGAGRLDAYEAVKMAKDMADTFGTVEVKNRILYRPWFYKLETAPYEIKLSNNDVSQGSKLKFRARNNIEILSGEYAPSSSGYLDLQIDENLVLNDCPPPPSSNARMGNNINNTKSKSTKFTLNPTWITDKTTITDLREVKSNLDIKVFDIKGLEVISSTNLGSSKEHTLNLNKLQPGIYFIKVYDISGNNLHTAKVFKK